MLKIQCKILQRLVDCQENKGSGIFNGFATFKQLVLILEIFA